MHDSVRIHKKNHDTQTLRTQSESVSAKGFFEKKTRFSYFRLLLMLFNHINSDQNAHHDPAKHANVFKVIFKRRYFNFGDCSAK